MTPKHTDCNKHSDERCLDCRKCVILKFVRFGFTDYVFLPLHVPHVCVILKDNKPISAGFYNFSKRHAFGHSEGLKIGIKKDDSEIISVLLGG